MVRTVKTGKESSLMDLHLFILLLDKVIDPIDVLIEEILDVLVLMDLQGTGQQRDTGIIHVIIIVTFGAKWEDLSLIYSHYLLPHHRPPICLPPREHHPLLEEEELLLQVVATLEDLYRRD